MAQRIDGKAAAAKLRQQMAQETAELAQKGIVPRLVVIIVGEDPASQLYVRNKMKACQEVGIASQRMEMPEDTAQETLLEQIALLNQDPDVDGILVQLPLPRQIDPQAVIDAIAPEKDVDAFHPLTVGRMEQGEPTFLPCTPAGILELLHQYGISAAGKHCVVVGRSRIVGRPMASLMLQQDATVTVCHSRTPNLAEICRQADILITAAGKIGLITGDMVKEGAVVIDAATVRGEDGKTHGDVVFDQVEPKASFISPVPGGVGPMTVVMLLHNTILSARRRKARS